MVMEIGFVEARCSFQVGGKAIKMTRWVLFEARSSRFERREQVGTRFFSAVYFSRGTLPTKKGERRALLGT